MIKLSKNELKKLCQSLKDAGMNFGTTDKTPASVSDYKVIAYSWNTNGHKSAMLFSENGTLYYCEE